MIATSDLHTGVGDVSAHPRQARAVLTLARVEGRRLARHPAVICMIALAVVQTAPFLLSRDATSEHNVGWLLQVSAMMISLAALLAANLLALKSRRDGSEELFGSAPLSPAARTVALASAAVGLMAVLMLLYLAGDAAIRVAGKGAATDSGAALFPLFDLVQGPLVAGLFVLTGIAVARWFPAPVAGPVAIVGLFAVERLISSAAKDLTWVRLTPFDPTFLSDGGPLAAIHAVYLAGLGAAVLAVALTRQSGVGRGVRTLLVGGLLVAGISGALQLAS
jgi:hypothetical protein